ncbi:glycosyltransferase [Gemmatimonadota bacterium]
MPESPKPDPPSVAHLLAPAAFGGLESVVLALARGQAATGDEVSVAALLTPGDSAEPAFLHSLEDEGIPVYRLEVPPRGYLTERRAVRALLDDVRPRILHTHGYRPDVMDAPVARGLGIATVTTVHGFTGGGLKNRVYEWIQRRAFRHFDAVVAVSEGLRNELFASGVPSARLHTVVNAWEPTGSFLRQAEARAVLGVSDAAVLVGWVGRLTKEKGPDVMVRALGVLEPPVELSMVGSGSMQRGLTDLSTSLGLSSRVRWHGSLPHAAHYLRAFDVLTISSWTEGTPMVLLEAMAARVPIVATAVGGIPDVLSSREATLVPAGDPLALAEGIRGVLGNPAGAQEKAAAAEEKLFRDFAVGPWVRRYREIYASCGMD